MRTSREPESGPAADLAVIGGGSAGFAAAWAAARQGLSVVLVEGGDSLGGTATRGGVACWEPGVGGTGIPFDLYRRLKRDHPEAVGITSFGRHFCWQDGWHWPRALDKVIFPGGELLMDPQRSYRDTLRRHPGPGRQPTEAWCRAQWHGVSFLPEAMAALQKTLLEETGRVTIRLRTRVARVEARAGRVVRAILEDGADLRAGLWVDATGGAFCRALGCELLQGRDARGRFHEPGAPEEPDGEVNGVTLVYTITPGYPDAVEPLPADCPATCWWAPHFPPIHCVEYPDRRRSCNMLPTLQGRDFLALGDRAALDECRRRVRAHWHFLQTHWPEFRTFRLTGLAPMLGIRETGRVLCNAMLTETDIRLGLSRQTDPDLIAVADHAFDRHGDKGGACELAEPYGVPYRCLIPRGWRNLLVAGRAAGFSSLAASSCRLTRTMMQLGQAAGTAAVLARNQRMDFPDVPAPALRDVLKRQHVQLEWPLPDAVIRHVENSTPDGP